MREKRGQSAVELMIILAVGLVVLLGIMGLFFDVETNVSGQVEQRKARNAVDSLADAAEMVYQQGEGSRTRVYVSFPEEVNYINITNNLILMNLYVGGKERNVYRSLGFNLSGAFPVTPGNAYLYVESKASSVVISQNIVSDTSECGNNLQESGEVCDGTDLAGESCASQGYSSGTLACQAGCLAFGTSSCVITTTTTLQLAGQSCSAAAGETTNGTYPDNCDGTYPGACLSDAAGCDDGQYEDHNAGNLQYCGVQLSYSSSSVNDCNSILDVEVCFQWYITASGPTDCSIQVARDFEQWTLVKDDYNGAEANNVVDLAAHPNGNLYLVEDDKEVWQSADKGMSWTKIENDYSGESNSPLYLAGSPNGNLYIAEGDEDIWISKNNGLIWTKAAANMNGAGGDIMGMASNSSNALFVVDNKADVYASTNNASTWTLVNSDYSGADTDSGTADMTADDNDFLYILRDQDVYRSTDSGSTWSKINDDFNGEGDSNSGHAIADGNNSLFIIDGSQDTFKSGDNGTTWELMTSDMNGANGNVVGFDSEIGVLYAVDTVSDVWNATDVGPQWADVNNTCYTSEPSATFCQNVTSLYGWGCNDFFGSGIDGSHLRHQARSNQGSKQCLIDELYYNVTYVS